MKDCETFEVKINCGLKRGYSSGVVHSFKDALSLVDAFCSTHAVGVTVTPTTFVYPGGDEPGVIVGLAEYPRFPKGRLKLWELAHALAGRLLLALGQERLTIVATDRTVMLERTDFDAKGRAL